jgi:hypothetical protein
LLRIMLLSSSSGMDRLANVHARHDRPRLPAADFWGCHRKQSGRNLADTAGADGLGQFGNSLTF